MNTGKIKSKRSPVDPKRWPGIYKYELSKRFEGKPDVVYTITFKDPVSRRKIWEKIGTRSEGITAQLCSEIRAERMKTARHGEQVKTSKDLKRERLQHDRSLGWIADAYFTVKEEELKGYTTDKNRWDNHLKPIFEKRTVSSIGPVDIQRVKTAMKGKAAATTWNTLELLRRLCNWGYHHKYCPALPFTIKMPRRDNEVVEYLEPEQAAKLNAVLSEWKRQDVARMIKIAMLTGMRRGEIFKLRDRDIDHTHGLITIQAPKGGKTAQIPLSDSVAEIIKQQIEWRDKVYPDSELIFPGKKGAQRVECTAASRIKAKAGLPEKFRIFHGMRHHFAVTLANSGQVDISMIGQLLTHKSAAMTERYAAYLPKTVRAASELAATLIQGNGKEAKTAQVVALRRDGTNDGTSD